MSGRQARREWGWHPLRPLWAQRVVADAGVRRGDLVLDLGAGTGSLTGPLLLTGARVLAIELHEGRRTRLQQLGEYGDLTVVGADLRELMLPHRPFTVVANPPYQLSSGIVRTLLASPRLLAADLVLERGTARGFVERAHRAPRYRLTLGRRVPASAFGGRGVESAVLRIRRRSAETRYGFGS